ncbi:MAG: glucosamine-6-phosphate deaminase [Victivallales bacterium]|jgi:glucosamine-6-phosphate deaminase|nr:glucosamine-6-phosphate deaminase [Victivallales bacterium]
MKVSISSDKKIMGQKAAAVGAEFIREAIAKRGQANVVLACAPSQNPTYDALITEKGIDWSKVNIFHLDEYVGLKDDHPASFRLNLHKTILDRLPQKPMMFHPIPGDAPDIQNAVDQLDKEIKKIVVDVAFVGIGENGHVAFNDPPADFEQKKAYIIAQLDEVCRHQQYGEGWFPTMDAVPRIAITMSCQEIMRAAAIVNSVPDARKAKAVALALEGPISNLVPATIMRNHPNYFVFLDREAASLLKDKYE